MLNFLNFAKLVESEVTTLTRLIESRVLEQAGKCVVTGRIENKRGVGAEASSANQQSRSPQPSVFMYLMAKLLTTTQHNEVSDKPSPLNIFLVLTTLGIA
ncbi:hypothetical protein ACTXT7_005110 [Hymenolepis weldensis]